MTLLGRLALTFAFALAFALPLALAPGGQLRANDEVPGRVQDHPRFLRGGDLYTVSHGVLPATDLLFDHGRIEQIGAGLTVPAGAEVVDLAGARVYPGLIAPATTLGLVEIGAVRATSDRAEVGAVTPEAAAHVAYNPDSELIPTVRSHGITTAQVTPEGSLLRGRSFITHLDGWTKEDSAVKLLDGLAVAWPAVAVQNGFWVTDKREQQEKQMAESRRRLRRAFEEANAYFVAKAADPDLAVDLRWEAMRPVFAGDEPLYVEADDRRQIVEAVEFAAEWGVRLVIVGGLEADRVAELLRQHDVPVIVGSTNALPLRDDDDYDAVYRLPARLHEAGVRFCIAHDPGGAWDVRNLPLQAGQAVAHGLPEDAALRAITLSTAEILGLDKELGSLDVGKEATLFVSTGDVMDALGQRVVRMYIRGRAVDLDDRHKRLYRKYRQKPAG